MKTIHASISALFISTSILYAADSPALRRRHFPIRASAAREGLRIQAAIDAQPRRYRAIRPAPAQADLHIDPDQITEETAQVVEEKLGQNDE